MKVLKFGGTSMGSAEAMDKVVAIVAGAGSEMRQLVVVSAVSGTTDQLLQCGEMAANGDESYKNILQQLEEKHFAIVKTLVPVQQQSNALSFVKKSCNTIEDLCNGSFLMGEMTRRAQDRLVAYGELLSSYIITRVFESRGIDCEWKDARELIRTNSEFGHAAVDFEKTNQQINDFIRSSKKPVVILPGFVAADHNGHTTTLGRGGSDYTAAILAAAIPANELEIWTDVSGMMTADPRWVPNARIIPAIAYEEAMELSHFGAKVIYPPTLQPVLSKRIPLRIKNTFAPADPGTVIEFRPPVNQEVIRGISSIGQIALLSLEGSGMIGVPGFSKRLFEALSTNKVNVVLITQGSSEHSICVGIQAKDAVLAKRAIDEFFSHELLLKKVEPVKVETDLSIVALVGDQMKSHPGISGRMFGTLGRNGVNVRAIAQGSSERNISAVIATKDVRKAVNVLHEEFFEETKKQVNLFIAGVGNVGGKLLTQLQQQLDLLQNQLRLSIRVIGLARSQKQLIREEGIPLASWSSEFESATEGSIEEFVSKLISMNLRNSIFVDVTASAEVAGLYDRLLQKSVSVVACNKVAASSAFANYKELKQLSHSYNAAFRFETNVGAGLPVIGTLNDLVNSGDRIHRIEAVLSGTLNYVFNNYDGSKPFADVVRDAQNEGYTEPDPRLDLSGTDVMRKILILAREAGHPLEMENIGNEGFLPERCMQGSVEEFYKSMAAEEAHFKHILDAANGAGAKLKFVASFANGKAAVGLRHIDPAHDFYHLYGKDNIVLFYTDRYPDQPLVVKGAGAGADVTASGVFADIIRAAGDKN